MTDDNKKIQEQIGLIDREIETLREKRKTLLEVKDNYYNNTYYMEVSEMGKNYYYIKTLKYNPEEFHNAYIDGVSISIYRDKSFTIDVGSQTRKENLIKSSKEEFMKAYNKVIGLIDKIIES